MDGLNYHHLLYFWSVAKEGSVARASQSLKLAQPTISGQVRALEESIGEKLLVRSGRGLVLTEVGRMVFKYADEIFGLGRELQDSLKGHAPGRPMRLNVGVADVVPKLVAYRLLEPALRMTEEVVVSCREDKPEALLADLAVHGLDLVLADAPIASGMRVKAFNHLLGESTSSIFGIAKLEEKLRDRFPASLERAPFLLPMEGTTQRRNIDQWASERSLRLDLRGEFEDSALLKTFAQAGAGLFFAPTAIEKEICNQYDVEVVGRVEELKEKFYAISVERRLKHPAVVAISRSAREGIFRAGA